MSARWYEENREITLERTAKRRTKHRQKLRKYIKELKLHSKCADCGYAEMSEALEFDHVRGVKDKNISELVGGGYSIARLMEEIEKCDVVCAICHRVRTKRRREEKKNKHRSKGREGRKRSKEPARSSGLYSDALSGKQGNLGPGGGGATGGKAHPDENKRRAKSARARKPSELQTTKRGDG